MAVTRVTERAQIVHADLLGWIVWEEWTDDLVWAIKQLNPIAGSTGRSEPLLGKLLGNLRRRSDSHLWEFTHELLDQLQIEMIGVAVGDNDVVEILQTVDIDRAVATWVK